LCEALAEAEEKGEH